MACIAPGIPSRACRERFLSIDVLVLKNYTNNTPAPFSMLIRNCWQQQADTRPLCPEILECLHPMIRPKEPTSSLSAASAAAIPLSTSPSQAPRTVVDLLGLLEPLTSNPHVKADQELRALFTDKVVELLIQEETDTLKDTDKPFCRAVQRLLDNEGKVNNVFKRALLKIGAPNVSLPPCLRRHSLEHLLRGRRDQTTPSTEHPRDPECHLPILAEQESLRDSHVCADSRKGERTSSNP